MDMTVFIKAGKQRANMHLCCNKSTAHKPASKACQRCIISDPHSWPQRILAQGARGWQGLSRPRAESHFTAVF